MLFFSGNRAGLSATRITVANVEHTRLLAKRNGVRIVERLGDRTALRKRNDLAKLRG